MRALVTMAALLCISTGGVLRADDIPEARDDIWLDVERPYHGWVEFGLLPMVEVYGSAGTSAEGHLDVVVLVDTSLSTRHGSGADVNLDGHVGGIGWEYRRDTWSYLRAPQSSSDPDDSILRAELEALRRFAEAQHPEITRIGLVTFEEATTVHHSVGKPAHLLQSALRFLNDSRSDGRTDMAQAIRTGIDVLAEDSRTDEARSLAMILLSDGKPTVPAPDELAAERAIEAAREAASRGIRIYSVGLGVPEDETYALAEIARVSHGAFAALQNPGDILEALPRLDLRSLAQVEVVNRTTSATGRAMRVWANGGFSTFVELAEGVNKLEITALGNKGSRITEERVVYFRKEPPRRLGEAQLANRRLQEIRDRMRHRTLEVEIDHQREALRVEVENAKHKGDRERSLTIEAED